MAKRYLVPQYIEMADKIVGPLTLSQFLYLLGGGILSYFFYTFFDKPLAWPLIIIVGSLSLALAFLKIQDQPFLKFLGSLILYLIKPRKRIWQRVEGLPEIKLEDKHLKLKKPEPEKKTREEVKSELEKLAHLIESKGWSEMEGKEIGPGEEAFRMRIKSHQEIK